MLDKEYFINRETGQEFLSIQDYINSLKIDFDNDLKKGKLSPDGKNIDLDDPMIPIMMRYYLSHPHHTEIKDNRFNHR